MTAIGSTANGRPIAARPDTMPAARPAASPDDVQALRRAFAKADPRPAQAAIVKLPTQETGKAEAKPISPKLKLQQTAVRAEAAPREEAAIVHGRERDHGRFDADSGQERQQDGQLGFAQMTQPSVPTIAMPAMPAPQVDPSAFAQLLTQLWLRERGKGTKEVRVTFGDDAWPATGARLIRNAGGALDVQLHVAAAGGLDDKSLGGLRDQLAGQGLAVGALQLETSPLA